MTIEKDYRIDQLMGVIHRQGTKVLDPGTKIESDSTDVPRVDYGFDTRTPGLTVEVVDEKTIKIIEYPEPVTLVGEEINNDRYYSRYEYFRQIALGLERWRIIYKSP